MSCHLCIRKTGICPLDSTAIKISAPSEEKSESPSEMEFDPTENAGSDSSDSLCIVQLPLPVFSAEQFATGMKMAIISITTRTM